MKVFDIIVSTMNERIYDTLTNFKKYVSCNVGLIVVHQISDDKCYSDINLENVTYIKSRSLGLPSSRNLGLLVSNADYVIPTDDDIKFVDNFEDSLLAIVAKYPDSDGFTMKVATDSNISNDYKSYKNYDFAHTRRSLLQVSSVELVLKRNRLIAEDVLWDLRFGLGARYPGGLEVVFLQNAWKKGIKLRFVNEYLCIHPDESSGKTFSKDSIALRAKIFKRVFGHMAILFGAAFYVRKRNFFRSNGINFWSFLKIYIKNLKLK